MFFSWLAGLREVTQHDTTLILGDVRTSKPVGYFRLVRTRFSVPSG